MKSDNEGNKYEYQQEKIKVNSKKGEGKLGKKEEGKTTVHVSVESYIRSLYVERTKKSLSKKSTLGQSKSYLTA